ncbi:twin-arginine translocation signal domain-containing protein [Mycolicibacterium rhodesiae]|uniref:twin-arginine translocation signal domain-containing protein n=1 Tax=Mycolicibacterium rhodesiae TaxID=36814 RepID=UPI0013FE1193|nr:twin-arginine translocation signal domain-containing protein [Mycolicibacterium rhodesiae]
MCDRCTSGHKRPVSRRDVLRLAAAAPAVLGLAATPVLVGTPHAPAEPPLSDRSWLNDAAGSDHQPQSMGCRRVDAAGCAGV